MRAPAAASGDIAIPNLPLPLLLRAVPRAGALSRSICVPGVGRDADTPHSKFGGATCSPTDMVWEDCHAACGDILD